MRRSPRGSPTPSCARSWSGCGSELAPTLDPVPGIDVARYRADLLTRWSNPRIAHRLEQIGTDGAMKLPPRLLAPARELLADGQEPAAICLVVAAWLRRLGTAATRRRSRRRSRRRWRAPAARPRRPSARSAVSAVFGDDLRESAVFRGLLAEGLAALTSTAH